MIHREVFMRNALTLRCLRNADLQSAQAWMMHFDIHFRVKKIDRAIRNKLSVSVIPGNLKFIWFISSL